jgi:glycosyltransferase involved in cell wall biosynthesis
MRLDRVIGVLEPGGAQLSALRLSRAQSSLGVRTRLLVGDATQQGVALARQIGFEPEVFALHDELDHAQRQWTPDPAFAAWLRPRLAESDLVHAHMFGAWWAAADAAPCAVPVVASEHNAMSWPLGDFTPSAVAAAPRLAAFFAHGPRAREFGGSLGLDPGRLLEGRSPISGHARPRPGLEDPRITFTGRLRSDKGPDLLLHALALMGRPAVTYLVGDGPMAAGLRRSAEVLGLGRTVRMPGWSAEPGRYVAGAAVHVVPSREEAWSQSAVTALALGVPVIGTDVEGLPLTLGEGRGLVVPVDDPAALACTIGAVLAGAVQVDPAPGRKYAATFEAARIAADYFAVYAGLLDPRALVRGRREPAVERHRPWEAAHPAGSPFS